MSTLITMEEEKLSQKEEKPSKKRRVSFFKKRKKPLVRSSVREKKDRTFKRFFLWCIIIFVALCILGASLLAFQLYVLPHISFGQSVNIVSPKVSESIKPEEIKSRLSKKGYVVSNITVASQSAVIIARFEDSSILYLKDNNQVDRQIELFDAIVRQLVLDNKKALVVDLRYNKPIVKY